MNILESEHTTVTSVFLNIAQEWTFNILATNRPFAAADLILPIRDAEPDQKKWATLLDLIP